MKEFFRFMIDFFKPWRRKIGVVTLVMACVFIAALLRSTRNIDQFTWNVDDYSNEFVTSNGEQIKWGRMTSTEPQFLPQSAQWSNSHYSRAQIPLKWEWWICGIGKAINENHLPHFKSTLLVVSYWSIVIPLTLLSAYLLLSKPRVPAPEKITDPTPAEGI